MRRLLLQHDPETIAKGTWEALLSWPPELRRGEWADLLSGNPLRQRLARHATRFPLCDEHEATSIGPALKGAYKVPRDWSIDHFFLAPSDQVVMSNLLRVLSTRVRSLRVQEQFGSTAFGAALRQRNCATLEHLQVEVTGYEAYTEYLGLASKPARHERLKTLACDYYPLAPQRLKSLRLSQFPLLESAHLPLLTGSLRGLLASNDDHETNWLGQLHTLSLRVEQGPIDPTGDAYSATRGWVVDGENLKKEPEVRWGRLDRDLADLRALSPKLRRLSIRPGSSVVYSRVGLESVLALPKLEELWAPIPHDMDLSTAQALIAERAPELNFTVCGAYGEQAWQIWRRDPDDPSSPVLALPKHTLMFLPPYRG